MQVYQCAHATMYVPTTPAVCHAVEDTPPYLIAREPPT